MTIDPAKRRELTAELIHATARLAVAIAARMPADTRIASACGDVSELLVTLTGGSDPVPRALVKPIVEQPRRLTSSLEVGTWPGGEAPDIMGMIDKKRESE